ncbi:MAG: hypothetical protein IPP77_10155 [Bacteroidetes bacterium]|nr:hypothetical protein [Bacteroidota bacterium]
MIALFIKAQYEPNKVSFEGQVSALGSYSPLADRQAFIGVRYIPELNFDFRIDTFKRLYIEASANINLGLSFIPVDSATFSGNVLPYRVWARYTSRQFELRMGLQKIDFGSATLLRPMQWFNQIDPRDPLQLTNGVNALLGRYYFKNNANLWFWVLYANEKPRGFDAVKTSKWIPEFGGRAQYPVPRGEMALSYHRRTANSHNIAGITPYPYIQEDRVGLDGKWDVVVGLWFEISYIHKYRDVEFLTNQTLMNLGTDYTFGIGNGLNIMAEHLLIAYDYKPFRFQNLVNVTALSISYPFTMDDRLTCITAFSWETKGVSSTLYYEHQFKRVTGYIMAYYNPKTQIGIQQNELVNTFSGPGVRLMIVYNH